MHLYDTLVVGAGQAGLAAGYHLAGAGLDFALLEAGPAVGGAWPVSVASNHPAVPR